MTTDSASMNDTFIPPTDFVECLQELAAARPDDTALTVVAERNDHWIETVLTYRVFTQRVLALAATLQRLFTRDERVLILLDNDEHYAVSMFACFHAGVIAVPVFPPESARPQHMARLAGIAVDAQASGILTLSTLKDMVGTAASQLGVCTVIAVDDIDRTVADTWQPHRPAADDVAFLQYTSGSTSAPKGVMVTHANLMANERAIREGLSIGASDIFGVWSPLFHDMGLIGGLLQPFYSGIPCVLSSPRFFLERPVRWLQMIARHRVTISGGPDFAYRLCLDRVNDAQIDDLDLSSWRIAYTGAEPVRHDTMDAFSQRFASAGFDAGAVYPCYGLAEATLFVTGGRRGNGMVVSRFDDSALGDRRVQPDLEGAALVGCGSAPQDHHVRIADPDTGRPAADGAIGEIWAAGASIASGYWNKPAETAEAFVERDGTRWLRTGDLGFLDDGHLFVAGRLKDMIIVRGHNLYPHDIERVVESQIEAVRKGRVAAFAVSIDGIEGIGVAAEVSRGLQKLVAPQILADAIGVAVSEQCGQAPATIVLLNPGAMPKTSSGKLQRSACRKGWEKRSLDAYAAFQNGQCVVGEGTAGASGTTHATAAADATASDDVTRDLADIWRDLLGHDPSFRYASDAHFLALGGNSLAAVQLAARISQHWCVPFTISHIFDHPRLAAQAAAIRAQKQSGAPVPADVIPVLSADRRAQPLPLSSAQQRQWFLWRMDPLSTAYHVLGALRLKGQIDIDALRHAVSVMARRHESLRTTFIVESDGAISQVVHADRTIDVQLVDLRHVASAERDVRSTASLHALLGDPFDLIDGPVARVALVWLDEQVCILALAMHHIVSDGASMRILMSELGAVYSAGTAVDADTVLPAAPLQHGDYAVWEQAGGNDRDTAQQLTYWRETLAVEPGDAHPVLTLATDHPRTSTTQYVGGRCSLPLQEALLSRLRALAARHDATLPMLLLSAFQALLYRYSGQRDIRVGVPVANRTQPQLANVVGLFVNTLVVRQLFEGGEPLDQVLTNTRHAMIGAQRHPSLPLEALVEVLNPERSASHSPLFQVLFNYLQDDRNALEQWRHVEVERCELTPSDAQFDLALDVHERVQGAVTVTFVYAANLFESATIDRMSRHFLRVLTAFADDPLGCVGDINLLEPSEQQDLCVWSEDPTPYQEDEPVHRLIERQAGQHPDRIAVLFAGQSLAYAELNRRANRLAHYLMGLGAANDGLIGVCMERSPELVVAMLAVLKAGAAYVPLEPAYPAKRIADMLHESGVILSLTHTPTHATVARHDTLPFINVDALDLAGFSTANTGVEVHGENLAYVIYTSGSTGRPKGAANRHGALLNRLAWMQDAYALDPSDAVLQKTPFSFDVSVWEFFWPLMTGARLVLAEPGEHRDPERVRQLIRTHGITTLHFVPSMLAAFLSHDNAQACDKVKRIVCSGEALSAELQNDVFQKLPHVELVNLYGPTEAAIDVTHWTCHDDDAHLVPIGYPIGNVVVRVLDERLNQVPAGVAGELYLGGVALARGYAGRPGLSAERFVADVAAVGGARLYRTGDRVRWNAAGHLEYLGRLDHQVKIRGFRVELTEIEAQLLAQPEVRDAAVVVKETPGGQQLVAYLSARPGKIINVFDMRDRLSRSLPDYMVPAALVVLTELPVSANGKLDRNALPAPVYISAHAYTAPQGRTEETITDIWASALGLARVGAEDNFFELGGHSLLLVRVHAALEDALHPGLSVIDLFKYPTIRALARRIDHGHSDAEARRGMDHRSAPHAGRRAALLSRNRSHARSRS